MMEKRLALAAFAASVLAAAALAWSHITTTERLDRLLDRLQQLEGKIQQADLSVCNFSLAPVVYGIAFRKSERRLHMTPRYRLTSGECNEFTFYHHAGFGQPYVSGYADVTEDWVWVNARVEDARGANLPAEFRLAHKAGDRLYYDGTIHWYLGGVLHRLDGPAIIRPSGAFEWYRHGLLHRDDGPAVAYPDGSRYWYQNGKVHRDDGPAIDLPNGAQHWYRQGVLHCSDGPAIIYPNGSRSWYRHGRLMKHDRPASVS